MLTVTKVLMTAIAFTCLYHANADTWTDENGIVWTYTVKNGAATVGGGSYASLALNRSTVDDIVIPDVLGGCPVTTIAHCAFQGCSKNQIASLPSLWDGSGILRLIK